MKSGVVGLLLLVPQVIWAGELFRTRPFAVNPYMIVKTSVDKDGVYETKIYDKRKKNEKLFKSFCYSFDRCKKDHDDAVKWCLTHIPQIPILEEDLFPVLEEELEKIKQHKLHTPFEQSAIDRERFEWSYY